jgi:hypothetical protein
VSSAAITLCVASQRVFVVVYFVIDSVRKLLDTFSYIAASEKIMNYIGLVYILCCKFTVVIGLVESN